MTPRVHTSEALEKTTMLAVSLAKAIETFILDAYERGEAVGWKRGMEEAAKKISEKAESYRSSSYIDELTVAQNLKFVAEEIRAAIETSLRGEAPVEEKDK